MDHEFANFAEWGGADAHEPYAPPRDDSARRSPNKTVLPPKPPLNAIPKIGAKSVQSQPLPARPQVYSKREEPKPSKTNTLPYSSVVKNSPAQNSIPPNAALFNPRPGPKQKDHLKQPERPVPQRFRNESNQREHLKGQKPPAPPTTSVGTRQTAKPHNSFAKIRPQGLGDEERSEMRDVVAKDIAQYTQVLEPGIALPFELWFFWPDGAIDIEKLHSEYDISVFKDIRTNLRCRVTFDIPSKIIRCYAANEKDLPKIQQRLLGLYQEFTSKWNDQNAVNLLTVPTFQNYSNWINVPVRTSGNAGGRLAIPELDEERPASYLKDEIDRRRSKSLRANNRLMRKAIEICIKDLRLTDHHVRMRLFIGEMCLSRYRNSANMKPVGSSRMGQPDQCYYQYSLEEFEEMISEELAEMELRNRFKYATVLNEVSHSDLFGSPQMHYTNEFDFIEPDTKRALRLVVEYMYSHTLGELEVTQRRWLEVPPNEKHLTLNVIDFESYDVQFVVTAFSRSKNPVISSKLSSFENSVTFKSPPEGLLSEVRRRSRYKPDPRAPDIVRERCVVTYPIKGSNLSLELARCDTFKAPDANPYKLVEPASSSEWRMALYDPEWDSKMGELAYLGAGQEVTWPRTLKTFFSMKNSPPSESAKAGFKKFVADVEMIKAFLEQTGEVDNAELANEGLMNSRNLAEKPFPQTIVLETRG
ncbi:MAG: hypothetical protein Q9160_002626 [Pyrenula sp. 1 TL-2023]